MTEIETVTVDFEAMRRDVDRYLGLRKTKRLVVERDGEEILVLGPWLPGEERTPAPEGFLEELYDPPVHPDDPDFTEKLYAFLRENGSST
jgi:hypothetical protein